MPYGPTDLFREVMLASNKARVDMTAAEIQEVLHEISDAIGAALEPPIEPPPELVKKWSAPKAEKSAKHA
jgi:hypothetical protein